MDQPSTLFQQRRSLEVARTPVLDRIFSESKIGMIHLMERSLPFDPADSFLKMFSVLDGPFHDSSGQIEALGMNLSIPKGNSAFRCDLVTVENQLMVDWTAGAIGSKEATLLVKSLEKSLSEEGITLINSGGYRNILYIPDKMLEGDSGELSCVAPWGVFGKPVDLNFPKGKGSAFITNLMRHSQHVFQDHEVNQIRVDLGENPATMAWVWGGKSINTDKISMESQLAAYLFSDDPQMRGSAHLLHMENSRLNHIFHDSLDEDVLRSHIDSRQFVIIHAGLKIEKEFRENIHERIKRIETWDASFLEDLMGVLSAYSHRRILFLLSPRKWDMVGTDLPYMLWGDGIDPSKIKSEKSDIFHKKFRSTKKNKLIKMFFEKKSL
ncbi:MAG: hypothetical protein Q8Q33_02340 [Chlamydiota bacterium]|nr:hypothetical protein [Chlamydiota bacterium]